MSEDTLPGHQIDPLEARLVVFRQHPEPKGFQALRHELRQAGRGELLAELCATWAQHERDPVRAADAWSEAGESMLVLGETATAIEYLRTAIDLDPVNDRAVDRLLEVVEPTDPAHAVEIIEIELGELTKPTRSDASRRKADVITRRAAQHRRGGERWNEHRGRGDGAGGPWRQGGEGVAPGPEGGGAAGGG
jgi:hypothetical protein